MATDTLDAMVLRAMLRLARKRQEADDGAIALRVGAPPHAVRTALRRLDARGLVEHRPLSFSRLTIHGFALAVALLPRQTIAPRSVRRRASRAA